MRVLVADDSTAMSMIVIRMLRRTELPVDATTEASDGAEALDAVQGFGPDIILSDWNMPNMSGHEFPMNLRAHRNPTVFGLIGEVVG